MEYKELNQQQKAIVDCFEGIFANSEMSEKDFITSLAFILNKYKGRNK